ncbi:MAG TPA: peptidoglycan recognition family protein [Pyrinomonadaceae bacterium]|jgi:hypothetical protein|nr:peptidoglycan recognition family protein [Pyrinomonadaceae bacterium]
MSQRLLEDSTLAHSKIVERYAHFFDRPDLRLRFLNNTLTQQAASSARMNRSLGRFEFIKGSKMYEHLLELELYRLILQELKKLLPSAAKQRRQLLRRSKAPFSARLFFRCYQMRHVFCGAGLAVVAGMLFGFYTIVSRSTQSVFAERGQNVSRVADGAGAQDAAFKETSEKYLPDYRPEKVWLVEQKENYERYSNGGRILVDYETGNHERSYHALERGRLSNVRRVGHEPVGIVYHTSESDMLPFTSDNNDSIATRTRGLLEYVRKNKSYNYLIDRYGQVYRIVRDEHAANHAGNSVWADRENVYVGLNESFLGVSFETNSEAGTLGEQLTEAQIISARLLTQILRSRYQIDDANCTTHGLVSVNPSNMLIAYHHDWVRNFPFEAMGLSDKYKVAPASIGELGFTYDGEILSKLGGTLWAGVSLAEEEFAKRAGAAQTGAEELRRQMRDEYRAQMSRQIKLRSVSRVETEVHAGINPNPASATEEDEGQTQAGQKGF